jgi:prepilin-type N-terminal cleavage/methylation domain-containing protein
MGEVMQGTTLNAHRRLASSRDRSDGHAGSAGFALVEVLVSMAILAIVGTAIAGGIYTLVRTDGQQQSRAEASVIARNYEDALEAGPYKDCAVPADYSAQTLGVTMPSTATLTVTGVAYWNGTAPPTAQGPTDAQWATAFGATCSADKGLQRITYKVRSTTGASDTTTTRSVLKRFNGSLPEPPADPPPGGRKCVLSATTNVASTWVNETAWAQGTNYSTGSNSQELNILYLAGTRRYSYLRFDVAANKVCDNGVTLPAGATITGAEVRLYTFNIGGLPACGANSCWHVMERVPSTWSQSTLTWANQPCPTGYGTSCQAGGTASSILFQHGTGAFDWSPRYQRVQASQLTSDVQSFYNSPGTNFGWVIKEACAETYYKACGSISPGFQMASNRATNTDQRPTLTVYF